MTSSDQRTLIFSGADDASIGSASTSTSASSEKPDMYSADTQDGNETKEYYAPSLSNYAEKVTSSHLPSTASDSEAHAWLQKEFYAPSLSNYAAKVTSSHLPSTASDSEAHAWLQKDFYAPSRSNDAAMVTSSHLPSIKSDSEAHAWLQKVIDKLSACNLIDDISSSFQDQLNILNRYIGKYGLRCTKDQTCKLIKMIYGLISRQEGYAPVVHLAADLFVNLVRGSNLSRDDLVLDWRHIFLQYELILVGNEEHIKASAIEDAVRYSTQFYEKGVEKEIWKRIRSYLTPSSMHIMASLVANCMPSTGYEKEDFQMKNGDLVDDHFLPVLWHFYEKQEMNDDWTERVVGFFARLSEDSPCAALPFFLKHIHTIFARLNRSLGMTAREGNESDSIAATYAHYGKWIGCMLCTDPRVETHLLQLISVVEQHVHPSRNGTTETEPVLVSSLLQELTTVIMKRTRHGRLAEKAGGPTHNHFPALCESTVTAFVTALLNILDPGRIGGMTEFAACMLGDLAHLKPDLVIPHITKIMYPPVATLYKSEKLVGAASVFKQMLTRIAQGDHTRDEILEMTEADWQRAREHECSTKDDVTDDDVTVSTSEIEVCRGPKTADATPLNSPKHNTTTILVEEHKCHATLTRVGKANAKVVSATAFLLEDGMKINYKNGKSDVMSRLFRYDALLPHTEVGKTLNIPVQGSDYSMISMRFGTIRAKMEIDPNDDKGRFMTAFDNMMTNKGMTCTDDKHDDVIDDYDEANEAGNMTFNSQADLDALNSTFDPLTLTPLASSTFISRREDSDGPSTLNFGEESGSSAASTPRCKSSATDLVALAAAIESEPNITSREKAIALALRMMGNETPAIPMTQLSSVSRLLAAAGDRSAMARLQQMYEDANPALVGGNAAAAVRGGRPGRVAAIKRAMQERNLSKIGVNGTFDEAAVPSKDGKRTVGRIGEAKDASSILTDMGRRRRTSDDDQSPPHRRSVPTASKKSIALTAADKSRLRYDKAANGELLTENGCPELDLVSSLPVYWGAIDDDVLDGVLAEPNDALICDASEGATTPQLVLAVRNGEGEIEQLQIEYRNEKLWMNKVELVTYLQKSGLTLLRREYNFKCSQIESRTVKRTKTQLTSFGGDFGYATLALDDMRKIPVTIIAVTDADADTLLGCVLKLHHIRLWNCWGLSTEAETVSHLVFEHIPGSSLGQHIRLQRRQTIDSHSICRSMLEALAYLEKAQFVHHHLDLDAFLVTDQFLEQVKLMIYTFDGGQCRPSDTPKDVHEISVERARYLPYECLPYEDGREGTPYDTRSMIYSFGNVMWALTHDGQQPFTNMNHELIKSRKYRQYTRPEVNPVKLHGKIAKIVNESCWVSRAKRMSFQSMLEKVVRVKTYDNTRDYSLDPHTSSSEDLSD